MALKQYDDNGNVICYMCGCTLTVPEDYELADGDCAICLTCDDAMNEAKTLATQEGVSKSVH